MFRHAPNTGFHMLKLHHPNILILSKHPSPLSQYNFSWNHLLAMISMESSPSQDMLILFQFYSFTVTRASQSIFSKVQLGLALSEKKSPHTQALKW